MDMNALASSFTPAFMGFAQETGDFQVAKQMAALEQAKISMQGSIAAMGDKAATADRAAKKESLELQIKSQEAQESTRQKGWVAQREADKKLQDDRIASNDRQNKINAQLDALKAKYSDNAGNVAAGARRENLNGLRTGDFLDHYTDEEFEAHIADERAKSTKSKNLSGKQAITSSLGIAAYDNAKTDVEMGHEKVLTTLQNEMLNSYNMRTTTDGWAWGSDPTETNAGSAGFLPELISNPTMYLGLLRTAENTPESTLVGRTSEFFEHLTTGMSTIVGAGGNVYGLVEGQDMRDLALWKPAMEILEGWDTVGLSSEKMRNETYSSLIKRGFSEGEALEVVSGMSNQFSWEETTLNMQAGKISRKQFNDALTLRALEDSGKKLTSEENGQMRVVENALKDNNMTWNPMFNPEYLESEGAIGEDQNKYGEKPLLTFSVNPTKAAYSTRANDGNTSSRRFGNAIANQIDLGGANLGEDAGNNFRNIFGLLSDQINGAEMPMEELEEKIRSSMKGLSIVAFDSIFDGFENLNSQEINNSYIEQLKNSGMSIDEDKVFETERSSKEFVKSLKKVSSLWNSVSGAGSMGGDKDPEFLQGMIDGGSQHLFTQTAKNLGINPRTQDPYEIQGIKSEIGNLVWQDLVSGPLKNYPKHIQEQLFKQTMTDIDKLGELGDVYSGETETLTNLLQEHTGQRDALGEELRDYDEASMRRYRGAGQRHQAGYEKEVQAILDGMPDGMP